MREWVWTQGRCLNFLALGEKIKHPPPNQPANVAFVDIEVPINFFPSSFLRFLPTCNFDKNTAINLLGIITLQEMSDDEELFVDYWDIFVYDKEKAPDWLTVPPPALGHLFMKKAFENKMPLFTEVAKNLFLPDAVLNRMDLQLLIDSKIEKLLPVGLRKEAISQLPGGEKEKEGAAKALTKDRGSK